MIEVFASFASRKPDEVWSDHGLTVDAWMAKHAPGYLPGPVQPVTVTVNGDLLEPEAWPRTRIAEDDRVQVRVRPQGSDVDKAIGTITGVRLFRRAVEWAVRHSIDVPGAPKSGQRGADVQLAEATANAPRLGAPIPELLGRYIRYPDYLNQPRRYFVDEVTQALDLLMCVGAGEYDIDTATIRIGETPVENISGLVSYEIFGPGEDVTGHQAYQNWYNAPEVGASVGSAGIRLRGSDGFSINHLTARGTPSYYYFNGSNITIPSDAGAFPDDWEAGMLLQVFIPHDVTIVDGGEDSSGLLHDTIQGTFRTFSDGTSADTVRLFGDVNGTYLVNSFTDGTPDEITLDKTDGSPVVNLAAGSARIDIDYNGVTYRIDSITSQQAVVTRLNPDGSEDAGWAGFDTEYSYDAVVQLDGSSIDGIWSGPFLACPESEVTDTVEIDIFAPGGVGTTNDSGTVDELQREVELQYRDAATGGAWTPVTFDVSGASRNQLGWTFRTTLLSEMTPEVRLRRTSLENNSTGALDRFEWVGLRSRLDAPGSYAGVTTIAMTITGSDTISNQSETKVNLEATRKLPVLSGGTLSANTATRRIESAVIHIAQSIGYGTDQLDLDELERLGTIWNDRGDYFDYVFSDTTVRDAINDVLRAGFAELTVMDGVITPARDEARTTWEQSYSPANMTGPLRRSFQTQRVDEPDGVEVEFVDADTWTRETVQCGLTGDLFSKVDKIKLDGVTDRTRAWRIGMRRRRMQRYRRWVYEFETEMDALNSGYLSYVPLIDDVPGYGKASIILAITPDSDGDVITLSEPMEWVAGETHVIAYRDEYGELVGPFTATQGDTDYQVIADLDPIPDLTARQEPPHAYFGTTTRWSFPALVTDVRPQGPVNVTVQAVNYDARVYDDDDNGPSS